MSDAQNGPQFDTIAFEGFTGLNTESSRPAIADTEMSWCDGFMPIGAGQLRTIPGSGAPIFESPIGANTVRFFDFYNVGSTPYMLVFLSDGSIYRVNTVTLGNSQIAPPGTIHSPARQFVGVSQWGSQFAIIVANQPNGYFIADDTQFYKAGGLAPATPDTVTFEGAGYTSVPSYTVYGGSGSGVTLTPIILNGGVAGVTINNPGSGYGLNDVVQVQFSGGGAETGAIIEATAAGGIVNGIAIVNGGGGYVGTPTLTIEGGGGVGATATVAAVTGGVITALALTNAGFGYTSNPSVVITPGSNLAAQAILPVMPFGVQGTGVETYQSRVWVANAGEMLFTGPESYTDFSSSAGGGNFQSTDSFQRVQYVRPVQTNGFLYILSDSSINYISNVTTSGSPSVTTFTNQNANPEVGTPYPGAIDVLGSNIVFANAFGAHVSYGGNATKISTPLDGVYNTVANFDGNQLASAKHILYGKRVWVLLVPIIDPTSGNFSNKMFMWDEKKWWSTNQDINVSYIQHQEINSVISAFGTDGQNVYPLFVVPTTGFQKTVQSKLWGKPGGYSYLKSANRVWMVAQYYNIASPNVTFSVDNEIESNSVILEPNTSTISSITYYVSPPTAISQTGNLLGITLSTVCPDMTIISAEIDAVPVGYRG